MHQNEIRITDENRDTLYYEAEALGKTYIAALKEQERRQRETYVTGT